ncbi:MAG TPA: hypothetical protein VEX13_04755 [Chloroflexia bacterium]|nr:hypothetical protein [Chloroflexia bacterium]
MEPTRLFSIISWILLPTVMFGGYALMGLIVKGSVLTPLKEVFFRAGHGHAGSLLVLSLVYYQYLGGTGLSDGIQWLACFTVLVGVLAVAGGFFLHMSKAEPQRTSPGIALTSVGALLMSLAIAILVWGVVAS